MKKLNSKYAEKAVGKTTEEIVDMFTKDNIEISIKSAEKCVESLKRHRYYFRRKTR